MGGLKTKDPAGEWQGLLWEEEKRRLFIKFLIAEQTVLILVLFREAGRLGLMSQQRTVNYRLHS